MIFTAKSTLIRPDFDMKVAHDASQSDVISPIDNPVVKANLCKDQ